ncbi:very long chain fatty acid elongase 1-like isoform X2 [Musca autumnalis]|uniref:very long chain fatty acid elongase 1-like isoform X2 n=1 Tax=Musca autumnalis TaxID=221902 RepID=UPI003CE817F4
MLLLKLLFEAIVYSVNDLKIDERITTHPILGSPWPMFSSIILYFLLILVIGKNFMKNRQPYKVKSYMQIYNIVQILLNTFIFYAALHITVMSSDYSFKCQPHNPFDRRPNTMRFVRPAILYYISKYLDFFDTVFFVLRKKNNQITFLHLYHHSIMLLAVYVYLSQAFASHATPTALVNSFIHIVMYTYYMIAAAKPNIDLTPWKKTLTSMQLMQFVLVDERITTNPILGSPWLMLASILFYLWLILVVGKKFMKNRKPFKVDMFMQLYNIVQICLNAFIFYEFVRYTIMRSDYSLKCEPFNPHDRRPETMKLVRPTVLYYISKYLDFFDTPHIQHLSVY